MKIRDGKLLDLQYMLLNFSIRRTETRSRLNAWAHRHQINIGRGQTLKIKAKEPQHNGTAKFSRWGPTV